MWADYSTSLEESTDYADYADWVIQGHVQAAGAATGGRRFRGLQSRIFIFHFPFIISHFPFD